MTTDSTSVPDALQCISCARKCLIFCTDAAWARQTEQQGRAVRRRLSECFCRLLGPSNIDACADFSLSGSAVAISSAFLLAVPAVLCHTARQRGHNSATISLSLSLSLSPQGLVAAEVATSARFVPMVTNRVKINMMHCLHVLSPRHVLRAERFTRCTIFHVTPSP